jgi:hypothetical protein
MVLTAEDAEVFAEKKDTNPLGKTLSQTHENSELTNLINCFETKYIDHEQKNHSPDHPRC